MPAPPIAILSTGLVTSVGLSAPATCAAIRAKVSNPTDTSFIGSDGDWIMAHQVQLEKPLRGLAKLTYMAAMAIEECLVGIPRNLWAEIPLLLCVAERERPGRLAGLDELLFLNIEKWLGLQFAVGSATIAHGRVSAAIALDEARKLISTGKAPLVIIAAVDSLLTWPTLMVFERTNRLFKASNSNGFVPGEAAGSILAGQSGGIGGLRCLGVGFGTEKARVDTEEPLRAEGLTSAIKASLAEAGCELHELDYRIADLAGEQYYFKEASLSIARSLRSYKAVLDLWHPAESVGETGAAAGIICVALAVIAACKGYAPGRRALIHLSADNGRRAGIVLSSTCTQ